MTLQTNPDTSAHIVKMLVQFLDSKQINAHHLYQNIGLNDAEGIDGARISLRQCDEIWTQAIGLYDKAKFGIEFGQFIADMASNHILGLLLQNGDNIERALQSLAQFHDILDASRLVSYSRDEKYFFLSTIEHGDPCQTEPISIALFTVIILILKKASFEDIRPSKISFSFPEPEYSQGLRQFFKTEILFNQSLSELCYDTQLADKKLPMSNKHLFQALQVHASQSLLEIKKNSSWEGKVARIVYNMIEEGAQTSLESVAKNLHLTTRTLQNHLKKEQTSFTIVSAKVKRQLADYFVNQLKLNQTEIAFRLGYADQSAFIHASRRWQKLET